ncbi:MAG: methyltransferase domain-containing protein [Alphaproteobacteria bacterium]|nr:methyltransferase domain-containing protein [Alphaproteobacteria bacterium]
MRRGHFAAFVPHCPRCAGAAAGRHPLLLASVFAEQDDDVRAGMLHCSNAACRHEYPIIDGIPLILPRLRTLLAERGVELFLRDDLAEPLESLLGDAIGPNSWFDVMRQTISTYAWDGWADLDPEEPAPDATAPAPGAARRCLDALLALAGDAPAGRVLDLGCGAGRTTFDLAARHPEALVLGIDVNLALLRLAHGAMRGRICYPRRRIGLVYDRRAFAVDLPAAARVDFWACDAAALPFEPGAAALIAALNLLDCVPDPAALLAALGTALRPGGRLLLATPYDWATRATQVEGWIGGHSQRGEDGGAAEPRLRALLGDLRVLGEVAAFPWATRLHARSAVAYRSHLLAAQRAG